MTVIRTRSAQAPLRISTLSWAVAVALGTSMGMAPRPALANPVGEKLVAGNASVLRDGANLVVNQTSARAIIDWQGFSIGTGELTRFVQPGPLSATLNRVVSGNPSALLGRLEANGKVYLINPNGVLVGPGAAIDTHSFLASTLDVSNPQFLAGGDFELSGASGAAVRNFGRIRAHGGDVFLIAHSIENAGTIEARKGVAGLAAGHDVLLKAAGDERVFVRGTVPSPPSGGDGVDNSGVILAVQAELKAAGGNVYSLAVNNSGSVHANGLVEQDGRILLTADGGDIRHTGRLAASNADDSGGTVRMAAGTNATASSSGAIAAQGTAAGTRGGKVTITGERVVLTGEARIDVSGDAGGGTARIGGGFQGRDADVANAQRTRVGRDARIAADAITQGDGGTVIVWADQDTSFQGRISAHGGALAGAGGFTEVSGKQSLAFNGTVDLGAAQGKTGTLLLDPKNIVVATGGGAVTTDTDRFEANPSGDTTIDPVTLAASNAAVTLQANNDITFNNAVVLGVGNSLTARAGRSVLVNADLTTASAAVTLTANDPGADATQRDAGAGALTMAAGTRIGSGGGDISLRVGTGTSAGNMLVAGVNSGGGKTLLATTSGGITQHTAGAAPGVQGNRLEVATTGGDVTLDNVNNNVGRLYAGNGAAFTYVNATALTVGDAGAAGAPQLPTGTAGASVRTVAGDLTLAGDVTTAAGATGTLTLDAGASLVVNGSVGSVASRDTSVVLRAAGDVTVGSENILARNLTATSTAGRVAFSRGGAQLVAINDGAPNGTVTLTAPLGVSTAATSDLRGRALTVVVSNGNVALSGISAFSTVAADVSGTLSMARTENAFDELGAITTGGDLTISEGADQNGLRIVGNVESTGGDVRIATSGNAFVRPGGRVAVGSARSVDFRTNQGLIGDDGADSVSFVAGGLALAGDSLGSTSNPLNTQVSRLEARGVSIHVQNTGPLAIGGVASDLNGLFATGRETGTLTSISLRNDQSISVATPGEVVSTFIGGLVGDVTLQTTRADADIIASQAVTTFGRAVTLNAARDLRLGDDAANRGGNVTGEGVNLVAGRSIQITGPTQVVSTSLAAVIATAGQSITVTPPSAVSEPDAPQIRSRGNVTLAASNGAIDLNNGATARPVIVANQNATGAKVDLSAPELNLASRVDANGGPVFLRQATPTQAISVGFESPGTLSISDAELDRIAAGTVTIGAATHPGNITVDGAITRPASGSYGTLALETDGALFVNGDVDLGTASLTLNSRNTVSAFANLTAGAVNATSRAGSVSLNGRLRVATLAVAAPAGNVSATNDGNEIGTLGTVLFNNAFNLKDSSGGLATSAFIDGGADSNATIEVRGGPLSLNTGTKIFVSGAANDLRLFSDTGFNNNVDGSVLVMENGARYLIYSPTEDATRLGGLVPNFTLTGIAFPQRPVNAGNGVLHAAGPPAPHPPAPPAPTPPAPAPAPPEPPAPPAPPAATPPAPPAATPTAPPVATPPVATPPAATPPAATPSAPAPPAPPAPAPTPAAPTAPAPTASTPTTAPSASDVPVDGTAAALKEASDLSQFVPRTTQLREASTLTSAAAALTRLANVDLDRSAADSASFRAFINAMGAVNDALVDYRLRLTTLIERDRLVMIPEQTAFLGRMVRDVDETSQRVSDAFTRFFIGDLTANRLRNITVGALADPIALMAEVDRLEGMNQGQRDLADRRAAEAAERERVAAAAAAAAATEARRLADIAAAVRARAVTAARKIVVTSRGPVFVSDGSEIQYDANGLPQFNFVTATDVGLGQVVGIAEIRRMAQATGARLTEDDVRKIVIAGGNRLTPGVIAAIISGGAGNFTQAQVNGIISGGGGNLTQAAQFAVINAGIISNDRASLLGKDLAAIISGGAGNIISGGAGNIVSGGAGNIISGGAGNIISGGAGNIVSNDGVSLLGQDGAGIISGGAGNFSTQMASFVTNGAIPPGNIAAIISGGGGNIISGGAGNIISGGAGNFNVFAGIAAGVIPQDQLASIISGGAGNFASLASMAGIISGGAGNIISGGGGNIISGGGGNIISGGGGNIISGGGGNLAPTTAGSNLVNLGRIQ